MTKVQRIQKGHWECKAHGKDCNSYVDGWAADWNKKRITPGKIPRGDDAGAKIALRWVEEKT